MYGMKNSALQNSKTMSAWVSFNYRTLVFLYQISDECLAWCCQMEDAEHQAPWLRNNRDEENMEEQIV